jgi:hypothetical protein
MVGRGSRREREGRTEVCFEMVKRRYGEEGTVVQKSYDATAHDIITAASCTTNCLAPIVKVVHEKIGIVRGALTTIHCVTNTQTIIDAPNHKKSDLRRARSGLMNLAPTSTGSATAIALIFPELKGKLNGKDASKQQNGRQSLLYPLYGSDAVVHI